jgi:hypothetical protein
MDWGYSSQELQRKRVYDGLQSLQQYITHISSLYPVSIVSHPLYPLSLSSLSLFLFSLSIFSFYPLSLSSLSILSIFSLCCRPCVCGHLLGVLNKSSE